MINDLDLGFFTVQPRARYLQTVYCNMNLASDMVFGMQNWLGIGIVVLLFAYHYIIADPKYAERPVTAN